VFFFIITIIKVINKLTITYCALWSQNAVNLSSESVQPCRTITVWTVVHAVLTAISQSNGNGQTSISHRIQTP